MDTISADDIIKRAIRRERLLVAGANVQGLAVTFGILTRDVSESYWLWTRALGLGVMIVGLIMILMGVSLGPRGRHPAIEAWWMSPAEQLFRRIVTYVLVSSLATGQLVIAGLYWLSGKGFSYMDGVFVGLQISLLPLVALCFLFPRGVKP